MLAEKDSVNGTSFQLMNRLTFDGKGALWVSDVARGAGLLLLLDHNQLQPAHSEITTTDVDIAGGTDE